MTYTSFRTGIIMILFLVILGALMVIRVRREVRDERELARLAELEDALFDLEKHGMAASDVYAQLHAEYSELLRRHAEWIE